MRPFLVKHFWLGAVGISLCLPPRAAVAHEGHNHDRPVAKVADQIAWKPTAIPERILLSWAGDPAHTQAVTWRTDTSVNHGLAAECASRPWARFVEKAVEVAAETVPFESDLGTAHYHTVQFDHLQPKTKYAYRVDGTNWSEWIQFTTASDQNEPFTFVYFGDAQNLLKSHWSRVIRQAYRNAQGSLSVARGRPDQSGRGRRQMGRMVYAGSFIHRMVPCIATPGNHEYPRPPGLLGRLKSEQLARHWRPTFAFPQNGPAGLEESVYWIDYQGTRIISLNSNERQQDQVPWLEEVLRENPNRWTILTFHHPIYSPKAGRQSGATESVAADL